MTTVFKISNNSGQGPVLCFVAEGTSNDTWFTLPLDYSDPSQSDWHPPVGWESVYFQDQNGKRRGFYLEGFADRDLEIQFYGIERDLGLRYIDPATGDPAPGI